jgi:PAS domain S-box-containing protein
MQPGSDGAVFLSTQPATRRDRAPAFAVIGVLSVLFALAVPFARVPLTPIPAFIASQQSALAINDLITAILLYSQFALRRSWAMLVLASAYLFTAAVAIVHGLTFPGLFTPTGLLGAGPQTAVSLDMVWHGVFPLLVIAYALTKELDGGPRVPWSTARAVSTSIVAIGAAVAVLTWIVTAQHHLLPILLSQGHFTQTMTSVVASLWLLSFIALLVLWSRRPHSVIDVWLMVVLCAWLFDITLAAMLNPARFDLGFYAARIYSLCAASFLLGVLLVDNVARQAKMARLLGALRLKAASDRAHYVERERLFNAVVESSKDAIIANALDGTITAWNKAAEDLFGYSAAEAIGQNISIIVPPDRRNEMDDIVARIGQGETIDHHETVRLHKDGLKVEVSLSISPVRSAAGGIVGASEIARDVTESKRTRSALNREREERQRIFETSQDLILVSDSVGHLIQVSPSVTEILGYRPDEMVGHNGIEFIHPEDLPGARVEMQKARKGRLIRSFETRYIHKDGHAVTLNWMGAWSNAAQRHFFIGRDLTEKRAAEAQFRQAQKMEAIGQLTGGIAHDFNNILTVITGTISILTDAVADNPELASIARLMDEAAERGAQLTKQLLAFARKQPLQPREIDVNALLLESAKLLRPTLGEQIEISPTLADDAWPALADPNQLSTAILNLALNARDAMPNGGKLMFETLNVSLDEGYANMNNDVAVGDYVMIAVTDTGSGIPAALLDKVFDPFFTTKEVGKGTGLGLSMVFGFVKQSGGHIKIYSEQDHGTTVKIYLPRSTGAVQSASEARPQAEVERGSETVLIVEDDALVRKYVVSQVASLGYATLEAANAAEALKIIDSGTIIDLLFTDVIMPGAMNGRKLVDEALRRRPALKTLFTSGYTENAIIHQGRLDPGVLLLAKPYRKADLARMIRLALGG